MGIEVVAIFIFIMSAFFGAAGFFAMNLAKKEKAAMAIKQKESRYDLFEMRLLNEISSKIGASMEPKNVADTIARFLPEFVECSAVCYMADLPQKIVFNMNLKSPVSYMFAGQVRERMQKELLQLVKKDFTGKKIEENFYGSVLLEESEKPLGSLIFIPLVISGRTEVLVSVAHEKPNFYSKEETLFLQKTAVSIGRAVTGLKEAIEAQNSRMNAMISGMTDGVIMTDIDYVILAVNPAAKIAAGLGIETQNLGILDFSRVLQAWFSLEDKIEEAIRLDKIFISEEMQLGDKFFKIAVSPVKDKNNWKTLGSVVVFRDMTKEKEIERIKEDFTSMIVHELRSPLDSIKKMAEMMRSSKIKKDKQESCLQMIYGSSSDMLELVGNLLDAAKIEAGKFQIAKQPSDIKETISSRVAFFETTAKDAKVTISARLGGLPGKVEFDPHLISEVLNNFISNAIKFNIENGFVEVQAFTHKKGLSFGKEASASGISCFLGEEGADLQDSLVVAATNSGAGVEPDQLGNLFTKFLQIKTVFAKKGGTGLGLAIAKSIIESHSGTVGAASQPGKGATFYFTIPLS